MSKLTVSAEKLSPKLSHEATISLAKTVLESTDFFAEEKTEIKTEEVLK
ncbi:MAG: hypothetical protein ACI4IW_04600 [Oscillospiraceae bacterium]